MRLLSVLVAVAVADVCAEPGTTVRGRWEVGIVVVVVGGGAD